MLAPDHHHFRSLDQSVNLDSLCQTQCSSTVTGNDRSDFMTGHVDRYLHQQAFVADLRNLSRQFVASADRVETDGLTFSSGARAAYSGDPLDLTPSDTVMTAGSLRRPNLALIDPLLQRRITNPR